jgi:hypothetical protein
VNLRPAFPAIVGLALFVCLSCVASASAAPSLARYDRADTERVELSNGRGLAVLQARGAIFGSIGRGTVRITDLPRGSATSISVYGAETVRRVDDRVTLYRGRDMSFYVERGWWKVRIQGENIDAGAAVKGRLTLRGQAGTYALRDGDPHPWPTQKRVFKLG